MNKSEAIQLAAMQIAALGHANMTASEAQGTAWASLMPEITFADAREALMEHLRASRFPATPADIIERVTALRARRRAEWDRADGQTPGPPVDPSDWRRYNIWLRAFYAGIGDGLSGPEADDRACQAAGVVRQALEERPRPVALDEVGKRVPSRG